MGPSRWGLILLLPGLVSCWGGSPPAPLTAQQVFDQAMALEDRQDLHGAVTAYGNLMADYPEWEHADRVRLKLGKLYEKLGDHLQARLEFNRLLQDYPYSPLVANAQYRIAETIFMDGDIRQASQEFYRYIRKYPAHSLRTDAEFHLATCYEEMGYFAEALKIYEGLKGRTSNPQVLDLKIKKINERRKNLGR